MPKHGFHLKLSQTRDTDNTHPKDGHLICNINDEPKVPRHASDKFGKWATSFKEYGESRFPKYCDGPGYLVGWSLARDIFNVSLHMPMFWLEDVFVTGIVPREAQRVLKKLKVRFHDVKPYYFRHSSKKWRTRQMISHIKQKKGVLMGPVDSSASLLSAWNELLAVGK